MTNPLFFFSKFFSPSCWDSCCNRMYSNYDESIKGSDSNLFLTLSTTMDGNLKK